MAQCLLNYCGRSMHRISYVTTNVRTVSYGVRSDHKTVRSIKFPDYTVLFEFKHKRIVGIFNRYKFYQTVISPAYMATHLILDQYFELNSTLTPILPFILVLHTTALFLITTPITDLIVCVYRGKEEDDIKISYVSFWGIRKDITIKKADIEILPESHQKKNMSFILIRSTNTKLKLPAMYANVHDDKGFCSVFGSDILEKYIS